MVSGDARGGIEREGIVELLRERARLVRKETLKVHALAEETRVASSLSCVEIFTVLYYGGVLRFRPREPGWEGRDRLIVSKGHGAMSLYPILADLGFFDLSELGRVCREGGLLGAIPDPRTPGFETINGSLGHGLGVGAGIALALKRKGRKERVFVVVGDGELYEGSIWEALMFAPFHGLDNLILVIDANKGCMLDFCRNVMDIEPIQEKLEAFGWDAVRVDGHDPGPLLSAFSGPGEERGKKPLAIIADTVKGKGVPALETDPLSHVRNLSPDAAASIIEAMG